MKKFLSFCSLIAASCVILHCSQDPEGKKMMGQSRAKVGASPLTGLALTAFRKMELQCKISKWRICQKTGLFTYGEKSAGNPIYYRCAIKEKQKVGKAEGKVDRYLDLSWIDQKCIEGKEKSYNDLLKGHYNPATNTVKIGSQEKKSRKGSNINQCGTEELSRKISQAYGGIWADIEEKAKSQNLEIMSRAENCATSLKAIKEDMKKDGSLEGIEANQSKDELRMALFELLQNTCFQVEGSSLGSVAIPAEGEDIYAAPATEPAFVGYSDLPKGIIKGERVPRAEQAATYDSPEPDGMNRAKVSLSSPSSSEDPYQRCNEWPPIQVTSKDLALLGVQFPDAYRGPPPQASVKKSCQKVEICKELASNIKEGRPKYFKACDLTGSKYDKKSGESRAACVKKSACKGNWTGSSPRCPDYGRWGNLDLPERNVCCFDCNEYGCPELEPCTKVFVKLCEEIKPFAGSGSTAERAEEPMKAEKVMKVTKVMKAEKAEKVMKAKRALRAGVKVMKVEKALRAGAGGLPLPSSREFKGLSVGYIGPESDCNLTFKNQAAPLPGTLEEPMEAKKVMKSKIMKSKIIEAKRALRAGWKVEKVKKAGTGFGGRLLDKGVCAFGVSSPQACRVLKENHRKKKAEPDRMNLANVSSAKKSDQPKEETGQKVSKPRLLDDGYDVEKKYYHGSKIYTVVNGSQVAEIHPACTGFIDQMPEAPEADPIRDPEADPIRDNESSRECNSNYDCPSDGESCIFLAFEAGVAARDRPLTVDDVICPKPSFCFCKRKCDSRLDCPKPTFCFDLDRDRFLDEDDEYDECSRKCFCKDG